MESGAGKTPLNRIPPLPDVVVGKPVLLAVSGGADSMFLLRYYGALLKRLGCQPIVVHCDHQQRGEESTSDRVFVEEQAKLFGLEALVYPYAGQGGDEATLRRWRLEAYRHAAAATGARAVALGHQREDLAESFLLMAMRGAGLSGLSAMRPAVLEADGLWFLRPLLDFSREEIRDALRAANCPWREDSTNSKPVFLRNRIRQELLPQLDALSEGTTNNLATSAEFLSDIRSFLDPFIEAHLRNSIVGAGRTTILINRETFATPREISLLPMMIARLLGQLLGDEEYDLVAMLPNRSQILSIREALEYREPHDALSWRWRGAWLVLTNHWLLLSRAGSESRAWREVAHALPILLEEHRATLHETEEEVRVILPSGTERRLVGELIVCAAGTLRGSLQLRKAASEETIDLLGGGRKSIIDVLREGHLPPSLRADALVLADEEGIVWVPGLRQAARTLVGDHSSLNPGTAIRIMEA